MRRNPVVMSGAVAVLTMGVARATPLVLPHSGRLLDAQDAPLHRVAQLSFRIHDASGAQVWASPTCPVDVRQGFFSVQLGHSGAGGCGTGLSTDQLAADGLRTLEIVVDGITLAPRQVIQAVPRAVAATVADHLTESGQAELEGRFARLQSGAPVAQTGSLRVSGSIQATSFVGGGAQLTFLDASALTLGTVDPARLPLSVVRVDAATGQIPLALLPPQIPDAARLGSASLQTFSGPLAALSFTGDGSGLTGVNASRVEGLTLSQLDARYATAGSVSQMGASTVTCGPNGQGKGKVFFDTENNVFVGCDGTQIVTLSGGSAGGTGLSASSPAASCRAILQRNSASPSDVYWVGSSVASALQVYCDMSIAGGGWIRVLQRNSAEGTALRTDAAVGAVSASTSSQKLSSDQINALVAGAPYEALVVRGSPAVEYFRWEGNTRTFQWSALEAADDWSKSACSNGAPLYRSTDGVSFAPYNPSGAAWALLSKCPSTFNKGGYFHFSDDAYRLRLFVRNETESQGYDFNDLRNQTSAWYVRPAAQAGSVGQTLGTSCNGIKAAGKSQGDGWYWIQPMGQSATQVWCDMNSDATAGWTLVTKYQNGGSSVGVALTAAAESANELLNPSVGVRAKYADAFINAIPWTAYKIDVAGDTARQIRTDNKFNVQWDAAAGASNGTVNGHNLQWCYVNTPAYGSRCSNLANTNSYGVSPHEAGDGGHWIHNPSSTGLGGFSCGFGSAAESNCSRYTDYFVVRHWVK